MNDELRLFQRGNASIWTDAHIRGRILAAHLDENSDAASRRPAVIDATVAWLGSFLSPGSRVLDLGCGPGLYAERLAALGHRVTGVDFNPAAIALGRERAEQAGLSIDYRTGDYLSMDLSGGYDLVMMIYCDFGALIPAEQATLLERVMGLLAPEASFAFDVFGPGLAARRKEFRSWYASKGDDFWSPAPYLLCEESKHFPEAKALASRYLLIEENGGAVKEFINWDQYYDGDGIARLLGASGLAVRELRRDLVPENEFSSGDVLFIRAAAR